MAGRFLVVELSAPIAEDLITPRCPRCPLRAREGIGVYFDYEKACITLLLSKTHTRNEAASLIALSKT